MPVLDALRANFGPMFLSGFEGVGENLGLSLEKLNPQIDEGTGREAKNKVFDRMIMFNYAKVTSLAESYTHHLQEVRRIQEGRKEVETFEIRSTSRVLLGTGNASVHDFGFNLNRPWGVPYIAGSTLKGLASSWLARHGDNDWWRSRAGAEKAPLQVELFGGIVKGDADKTSWIGSVVFNDALLVLSRDGKCFVADIITSHHMKYYGGSRLPDGTEDPNPVKIAALRPGLTFFVSLEGPARATALAREALTRALAEEGVGGKTAVGYGRFEVVQCAPPVKAQAAVVVENKPAAPVAKGEEIEVVLIDKKNKNKEWYATGVTHEGVIGTIKDDKKVLASAKVGERIIVVVKSYDVNCSAFQFVKKADQG